MKKEPTEVQIGCTTNNSNCCKKAEVPSDGEVAALNHMREIKTRVKELKKRLSEIYLRNGEFLMERSRLEKEMEALKSEWNELELKKEKAAHDRMIMLGHGKSG